MIYILIYKITKIVRALWLAERSVCMRVCKHGCGVKMFCFSRANHSSTNLKKFSSSKLDKFTLFTHSFFGWNLKNRYKEGVRVDFFFRLSWYYKREKSVFWKASFCKTRTDYACKTLWTIIIAIQRVLRFFAKKLFYKSNRKLFPCVCIDKHSRRWANSRQLCKLSPHVRESVFRNPGIFCSWNPEYWALESGIQHQESIILL